MIKYLTLTLMVLAITLTSYAQSSIPDTSMWVTNGQVNTIAFKDDTAYIGGRFTWIGPRVPYGVSIDTATGLPDMAMAKPNGPVDCSVADGSGGWYIGGYFTQVGGLARNSLAHILANGTVGNWNPDVNNGRVYAIAVNGNTVYVGGYFTSIGGQNRNYIAALDAVTGLVTTWDPNADSGVSTIKVDGNTVYVGGSFTSIGGQNRSSIAALNAVTGLATLWNPSPSPNLDVHTIAVNGNTVYVGGYFTSIGGQYRNNIAALDAVTGLATSWNPNANNDVFSIAINGNTVYVGGAFTGIGGQNRNYIAALDVVTGLATPWNPDPDYYTSGVIVVNGNTVYVGGGFSSIGGQYRNNIAAFDAVTGLITSWTPNAGDVVNTIAVNGNTVYLGGSFVSIGGQSRNNIAAINTNTGGSISWTPNVGGVVNTIAVKGNTVYVGGEFYSIGGQYRNNIAAFDAVTGLITSWNPNAGNTVNTIAVNGNTVYVGGGFTSIGGQSRSHIAALDASTGQATSWNPDPDYYGPSAIVVNGNTVYVGGYFTSIGGQYRSNIAALDAVTGLATSWNPNADDKVNAIAVNGNTVYVGGSFTSIGGQSRSHIAALDASTGQATSWNPDSDLGPFAIAVNGNTVYVGGFFYFIGGQSRNSQAALDTITGLATPWNPELGNLISDITIHGGYIYEGRGGTIPSNIIGSFIRFHLCTPPTIAISQTGNTLTCNATGAAAPYTYIWSNGSTSSSISTTGCGNYSVTVTAADGCNASSTYNMPLFALSETHTNPICTGNNGSINLTVVGGTLPYTYTWSNGVVTEDQTGIVSGIYSVSVTDQNGCSAYLIDTLTAQNTLADTIQTTLSCPSNPTGTITVTPTAGTPPYTLHWSSGSTTIANTGGSFTIPSLPVGAYTLSVTDAGGCSRIIPTAIQPVGFVVNPIVNPSCSNSATGSIDAGATGGTAPYSYTWSTGLTASTPLYTALPAGTYALTVNESSGCTSTASATVPSSSLLLTATTYPACNGVLNGQVDLTITGSNPPYYYQWSNGNLTQDLLNVGSGNYMVTITDASGCFVITSTTVGSSTAVVNLSGNTVVCPGVSAILNANTNTPGSNLYTWSYNAVTDPSVTVPSAGTYSVTLTTANNCTASASIVVQSQAVCTNLPPNAINDSYSVYQNGSAFMGDVLANDSDPELNAMMVANNPQVAPAHGVLSLSGNGSFSYLPNAGFNGLDSFVYTICDNGVPNACAAATVYLNVLPCTLSVSSNTTASCGTNGSASVTINNGTSPYTYNWSNGQHSASASNLAPGTCSVSVTDTHGCSATTSAVVAYNQTFNATLFATTPSCSQNFSILSVSGGQSYAWSNGSASNSIVASQAGFYSVTSTAGACTDVDTITVLPYMAIAVQQVPNCSAGQNAVSASVSGIATGSFTYNWSNGAAGNAINLSNGNYTLTVTDITGCQLTQSISVNVAAQFTLNAVAQPDLCGQGNGTVHVAVTGSYSGALNWSWSNGSGANPATGLSAGAYTVTAIDGLGCTAVAGATVAPVNPLSIALAVQSSSCAFNTGAASVAISTQGQAPYAYNWSNGSSAANTSTLPSGPVSVTVTDAQGCTATATSNVASYAQFNIQVATAPAVCGQTSGSAVVTVLGTPTGVLHYAWSNNAPDASTTTGLTAGNYMVTVSDGSACPQVAGFTVTAVNPYNLAIAKTPAWCIHSVGTATAVISGNPNGTVSYTWSTGAGNLSSIANLAIGTYAVTATDAAGCSFAMPFHISNATSIIDVVTSNHDSQCGLPNGSAEVSYVIGSPIGQLHYNWSSGSTTISAPNLIPGTYTVTVTDDYCTAISYAMVGDLHWVSPLIAGTYVQCTNASSGTAAVSLPAYITNPTYTWSNGQTTQTAINLAEGWYSVTVTGGNTCYGHGNVSIIRDPACNVHIAGKVVDDTPLQTCTMASQPGLNNKLLRCTGPNNFQDYRLTSPGGNYSFVGPEPGAYTVELLNTWQPFELPYEPVCGAMLSTTLANYGDVSPNNHFYMRLNDTIRNLMTIVSSSGTARPGVSRTYTVATRNLGGANATGQTALTWDANLDSPVLLTTGGNLDLVNRTATWNFNNLTPGSWSQDNISLAVPVSTAMGTQLSSVGVSTPVQGDHWPINNYFVYSQTVSNSFDPNDKNSNLGREIPVGDSLIAYTIRFQNTGTDTAYSIVVRDTLDDTVFDLNTFTPLSSSHPYHTERNGNIVTFYFNNIYLVDSFHNEPGSHGFVMFAIRLKSQLNAGAYIHNRASIYFDYNTPVVTNTAVNELVTGIFTAQDEKIYCSIYPNPTAGQATLRFEIPETADLSLEISDALGQKLWTKLLPATSAGIHYETLPSVPAGIWNLTLRSSKYTVVKRWVSLGK